MIDFFFANKQIPIELSGKKKYSKATITCLVGFDCIVGILNAANLYMFSFISASLNSEIFLNSMTLVANTDQITLSK